MELIDIMEAMRQRHSVRNYTDRPIEGEVLAILQETIETCNRAGNLKFRLVTDEPRAFSGPIAHYGHFSGVRNYVALIGDKADDLDERVGYWGELLTLKAQQLGLNTCWVALTYNKRKSGARPARGEKVPCVLTIGYGVNGGKPRRSRSFAEVAVAPDPMPQWFQAGVEAALLAPTAINQQKFRFTLLENGSVKAEALGGPYCRVDLGIAKYHFELGAGQPVVWEK